MSEDNIITNEDLNEVMKKYDLESNTRIWEGKWLTAVNCVMAVFSAYCILATLFSRAALEKRLTLFLGLVVLMGFLNYPASKKHVRPNSMPWYDVVIMLAGFASFLIYYFRYDSLVMTLSSSAKMTPFLAAVGLVAILSLIELCRRCVGVPILCVAGALVIYTFASGKNLYQVLHTLFYTTNGVFGTPAQVCAKFIVVFVVFGAFLERTGISAFFIELANKIAGASAGGPAKVAVISSALCGMVSGSSVGNTVTTGSVTIPMMKDTGYKPEFAGAVEAAASTGGQIMPPIMGAAAFLMADFVGVPYSNIIVRAILPAVLYFTGIFISVHLEAKRLGLKGIPKEKLPKFGILIRKIYLLLPLVMLVIWVSGNMMTMQRAASFAILLTIAVGLVDSENRITPFKIFEALEAGGRGTITVGAACGVAGIISGTITMTGLANELINAIVNVAGDRLIIALVLTMLCCIVLGMGVPTTANYCIMAATCAPILIRMGVPVLAAHFFVFYFGIVADITPPVALAAYAGSAIAKSNPMKTAFNASRLAIAVFIVPYVFAYSPSMLLIETNALEVIQISLTSLIGIFGVSSGLEGYLFAKMNPIIRAVFVIGGLMLIVPSLMTDLIGLGLIAAACVFQFTMGKKAVAA